MNTPIPNLPVELWRGPIAQQYPTLPKHSQNIAGIKVYTNRKFIQQEHEAILDKAHKLASRYLCFAKLSMVSPQLRNYIKDEKDRLGRKIVKVMDRLPQNSTGAQCLRECVDAGAYLAPLTIYYAYKPEALHNRASHPDNNEGFKRNILHNAVASNYSVFSPAFVKFILNMNKTHQLGLLEEKDCSGQMPIHKLCAYYPSKKLKKILKFDPNAKENVNALTSYNNETGFQATPLYFLCQRKHGYNIENEENIELFIKNGAEVNKLNEMGDTVLHLLADEQRNYEYIPLLLKHGADPTLKNKDGKTVLDLLLRHIQKVGAIDKLCVKKTISLLLKKGCQIPFSELRFIDPTSYVSQLSDWNKFEIIKFKKVDWTIQEEKTGNNYLHYLIDNCNFLNVKDFCELIKKENPVALQKMLNTKNAEGKTPYALSKTNKDFMMREVLDKYKSDIASSIKSVKPIDPTVKKPTKTARTIRARRINALPKPKPSIFERMCRAVASFFWHLFQGVKNLFRPSKAY